MLVVESGFEYRKIITKRLTKEFNHSGITLVEHKRMFPPTRDWTSRSEKAILKQNEIDADLVVTPGASAASIMPAVTQTSVLLVVITTKILALFRVAVVHLRIRSTLQNPKRNFQLFCLIYTQVEPLGTSTI